MIDVFLLDASGERCEASLARVSLPVAPAVGCPPPLPCRPPLQSMLKNLPCAHCQYVGAFQISWHTFSQKPPPGVQAGNRSCQLQAVRPYSPIISLCNPLQCSGGLMHITDRYHQNVA